MYVVKKLIKKELSKKKLRRLIPIVLLMTFVIFIPFFVSNVSADDNCSWHKNPDSNSENRYYGTYDSGNQQLTFCDPPDYTVNAEWPDGYNLRSGTGASTIPTGTVQKTPNVWEEAGWTDWGGAYSEGATVVRGTENVYSSREGLIKSMEAVIEEQC